MELNRRRVLHPGIQRTLREIVKEKREREREGERGEAQKKWSKRLRDDRWGGGGDGFLRRPRRREV